MLAPDSSGHPTTPKTIVTQTLMRDLGPTPPPRSAIDLFSELHDGHPHWFKPDLFLSPAFDTEFYISELRTFVPFDTLRSELRGHLASLNHDLVDLINRDFDVLVNLSTNLVDVDAAVIHMRALLLDFREKIEAFKESVLGSLVAMRNSLTQRSEAAAAREVLELLLDTFHIVSKVEKLIKELPSERGDYLNKKSCFSERPSTNRIISSQLNENGTNLIENQSMIMERIASEMNRMKFYITHAPNLPFIENMEKKIQSSSHILDASLGLCFVDGLVYRDENAIYNCLRAFAVTDKTSNAEEIFRTTIVAPLVQKVIGTNFSAVVTGAYQNVLENDYLKIKEGIEKDCKFILKIASTENSGLHVFNFLANSILKEVALAIHLKKPGAFSPGRPAEFLMNYNSSLDFLAYLEGHCSSRAAVAKFRSEAVYVDFMKQWNIVVYFSLRFQEVAGALVSSLASLNLVPVKKSSLVGQETQNLALEQSVTLLESLRFCWREDVLIHTFSDKFLRLSLQLLSRFSYWLESGLAACNDGNSESHPGCEWAFSASPDDFVCIIHDISCLVAEVQGNYLEHVANLLSSCSPDVIDIVKQSILQSGNSLISLLPYVMKAIIDSLVDKAIEDLRQVKGITATYRMTNKPVPVKHSSYVSQLLQPLKTFIEGERAATYLTEETRKSLLLGVAEEITRRYDELAGELVSLARKTESSLQRMRQGVQRRAGSSQDVSGNSMSDTEKICVQLFLDIQEYGRILSNLEVDPATLHSYHSLWRCVAPRERLSEFNL